MMACYRNILVALDGSADGYAALSHAVALAHDQGARLTLLSVAPPISAPASGGAPPPADLEHLHAGVLQAATASMPDDVSVTTRLTHGDPAEMIVWLAEEGNHDLIVMGSHGHSRVRRALLGSVSERVLRASVTPVLMMRAGKEVPAPAPAR